MRIATWNINSIRIRTDRLVAWLGKRQPDVLCLQEIKCEDELFPYEAVASLGYHAAVHGQKTYNGVALLSRTPAVDVERGLGDGVDDPQARFIAATIGGVRVASIYVPNGGEVGSDKYAYKLAFLRRLRRWLDGRQPVDKLVLCGDFNIAPTDADARNPAQWADTVLCTPEVRMALANLLVWGLDDAVRRHRPEPGLYSWWDYRMLGFQKNDGLRIDHLFATAALRSSDAWIDRDERKGQQPSDHVPVGVDFAEEP